VEKYSSLSDGCKAVFDAPPPPAATATTTVTTVPATKPVSDPQAIHTQTTKPATYTQTTMPNKPLTITPTLKRS
jgi:hypothetical protein